jgi:hypothetical protein
MGNEEIEPKILNILNCLNEGKNFKESKDVEYKKSVPNAGNYGNIPKQIASMLNTKGGYVIFGVDENSKELTGIIEEAKIEEFYNNAIKNKFKDQIENIDKVIKYGVRDFENKKFAYIAVSELKTNFVLYCGKLYIRKENGKSEAIKNCGQLKEFICKKLRTKKLLMEFEHLIKNIDNEVLAVNTFSQKIYCNETEKIKYIIETGGLPTGIPNEFFDTIEKIKDILYKEEDLKFIFSFEDDLKKLQKLVGDKLPTDGNEVKKKFEIIIKENKNYPIIIGLCDKITEKLRRMESILKSLSSNFP